jgi:hypothetical protein
MAVGVFQDDDVAGEERAVRTAQVQQHAVASGHGNDLKAGDVRRAQGGFSRIVIHGRHVRYQSSYNMERNIMDVSTQNYPW